MPTADLNHELEVARRVLDEGDPRHALQHLVGAFALAPNDERVHALFETVAQRVDIASNLPDAHFFGTHLVRAFTERRARKTDDAVTTLAQVATALPDRGLESLVAAWLFALSAEKRKLSGEASEQVGRLLIEGCRSTIGLNRLHPGERALLAGFGDLASALAAVGTSPIGASFAVGVLRRLGRYDEALALPIPPQGKEHQFALTQRGLTLRAMGEGARAGEVFAEIAALDPEGPDFIIEQARCGFVAGDFDRALALIASAPAASVDAEVTALEALCRARPEGDRLELLDGIRRAQAAPPLGLPSDATANIFRQTTDFVPGSAKMKVGVSGWESPSNRLLIAIYASATTDVATASYSRSLPALDFDPLSQRRGEGPPLWVARGDDVVQGVPAPLDDLRASVGRIAIANAEFPALWKASAELGQKLDPALARDLAATMVHPPVDAAWLGALPGVFHRHQVAAACVLANLPGAWSARRAIFESLVFGPLDWASAAAVSALGELARSDASVASEARELLVSAVADLVPHACEPRFWALHRALSSLPCVPRSALESLDAWYRANLDQPDEEAAAPTPAAAPVPEPLAKAADSAPAVTSPSEKTSPRWPWIIAAALAAAGLIALLGELR